MLPAVVLGIGGTGKWAVLDLKRLIEKKYGNIPSEVRLMAFDVTEQDVPSIQRFDFNPERGQFLPDELREGAYLKTFGLEKLQQISQRIEKYPQLESFLNNEDKEYIKQTSAQGTTEGAGKIRLLTRISFFINYDSLKNNIRDALNQVAPFFRENVPLRIIIISSLAGGTGCGTFIDFALLAHSLLKENHPQVDCYFYGIFSLPRGFQEVKPNDLENNIMLANCYAAWRELHRIQCCREYKVQYSSGEFREIIDERLFTWIYFVDGDVIRTFDDGLKPWFGINPSMAEFAEFLLEGKISQIERNWHTGLDQAWTNPNWDSKVYGTFGIHKWIIDIGELELSLAIKFTTKTIEHFLQTCPPDTGDTRTQNFMKDPRNSRFFKNVVYEILEKGLTLRPDVRYLFDNFKQGSGEENIALPEPKLEEIQLPLVANFPLVNRLLSKRVFDNIKKDAENRIRKNLGSESDFWRREVPFSRTTYGILNYLLDEQGRKFTVFLRDFSLEILNKEGLNFLIAFLETLVGTEESPGILLKAKEKIVEIFHEFDIPGNKKRISEALRKNEEKKQIKAFLMNLGKRYKYDQIDLLARYYSDLIQKAKEETEKLLKDAYSKRENLKDKKTTLEGFRGNLNGFRKGLREIKIHSYLTEPDDVNEEKLFNYAFAFASPEEGSPESNFLQRTGFLSHEIFWREFEWKLSQEGTFFLNVPDGFPGLNEKPGEWASKFLKSLLNDSFFQQLRSMTIFDFLAFLKKDVQSFIQDLQKKSEYLANLSKAFAAQYHQNNVSSPGIAVTPTDFKGIYWPQLRGNPGDEFRNELVNNREFINLGFNPNDWEEENALLTCQTTNFWSAKAFSSLVQDTERKYREIVNSGIIPVHILPEEKTASRIYESKLRDVLGEENRLLHPRVVSFLDDEKLLKAYTYAFIYQGFEYNSENHYYTCDIPDPVSGRITRRNLGETLIQVLENCKNEINLKNFILDFYQRKVHEKISNLGQYIEELRYYFEECRERIRQIGYYTPEELELLRLFALVISYEITFLEQARIRAERPILRGGR